MPMADDELLSILVCPLCRGPLVDNQEKSSLDCPSCRLRYPIRDGIPIMLVENAEKF